MGGGGGGGMEGKGRAKGYIQAGSVCGQKSEFFQS